MCMFTIFIVNIPRVILYFLYDWNYTFYTNVFLINKARIISHTNIFHTSKLLSGALGGGGGWGRGGRFDRPPRFSLNLVALT